MWPVAQTVSNTDVTTTSTSSRSEEAAPRRRPALGLKEAEMRLMLWLRLRIAPSGSTDTRRTAELRLPIKAINVPGHHARCNAGMDLKSDREDALRRARQVCVEGCALGRWSREHTFPEPCQLPGRQKHLRLYRAEYVGPILILQKGRRDEPIERGTVIERQRCRNEQHAFGRIRRQGTAPRAKRLFVDVVVPWLAGIGSMALNPDGVPSEVVDRQVAEPD